MLHLHLYLCNPFLGCQLEHQSPFLSNKVILVSIMLNLKFYLQALRCDADELDLSQSLRDVSDRILLIESSNCTFNVGALIFSTVAWSRAVEVTEQATCWCRCCRELTTFI